MRNYSRFALLFVLGFLLSACASGARLGAMTANVSSEAMVATSAPVYKAIEIRQVTGGTKTNPFLKSQVSSVNFRGALKQSLRYNGLLASEKGRYHLNATIIDIDQPVLGGTSIEVIASVHYTLSEMPANKVVFDQTIITPHVADSDDALVASERLRLANEGAVRDNIQAFINAIVNDAGLGK